MVAKMTKIAAGLLLSVFLIGCGSVLDAFETDTETKDNEIVVKKNTFGVLSIPSTGGSTSIPTDTDLDSAALEPATVEFTITKYPKYGTLIFTGNLAVYRPLTDYIGPDFFAFEIYDSYKVKIVTYNVSVEVIDAIAVPTISGTPPDVVFSGSVYNFAPTVANPIAPLLFSISNKPLWASFDVATGQLTGTPAIADVGTYSGITISATSGGYNLELPSFTITVVEGEPVPDNTPPEIYGVPSTEAFAEELYSFEPVGSDPDGDAITYAIANKPSWATFTTSSGRLYGTPTLADIGKITEDIIIWVSDGELIAELPSFSIEVK